jgi:microcystin-dependent protein
MKGKKMSDQYLGEIRMVGFNFAPVGWALCNGQTLSISTNTALFALLGTTYGGNGTQTFNLPDLQGRVPLHAGAGAGLPVYVQGQKAGAESVTLTQQQLPSHTHIATFTPSGGGGTPTVTINGSSSTATSSTPAGNYLANVVQGGAAHSGALYATTPGTLGALNSATATISGVGSGGGTVANALTGGSQPVSIEPPYLAVYFIIALSGIYPSRP